MVPTDPTESSRIHFKAVFPHSSVSVHRAVNGRVACLHQAAVQVPPFLVSSDGRLVGATADAPFVLVENFSAHRGNGSVTWMEGPLVKRPLQVYISEYILSSCLWGSYNQFLSYKPHF